MKMKLTIKNLDKIKEHFMELTNGVEYRIDRIVETPDSYRFYWHRQVLTNDEVVMIQLSRNPVEALLQNYTGQGYIYHLRIGDEVFAYVEPETVKNVSALVDRMTSLFKLL